MKPRSASASPTRPFPATIPVTLMQRGQTSYVRVASPESSSVAVAPST